MAAEYDVAIIGAGFAGLWLARNLSPDLKICIVEKNRAIGEELRTTGSTFFVSDGVLQRIPEQFVLNSYSSFSLHMQTTVENSFSRPVWCLLDVQKIQRWIAKQLRNVDFVLGVRAVSLERKEGKFSSCVLANGKSVRAKLFVEATGGASVLTGTQVRHPKIRSACYQVDAVATGSVDTTHVELYPFQSYSTGGYAYVFPIDKNHVRIGTCITGNQSAREQFTLFLQERKLKLKKITNTIDFSTYTGGTVSSNAQDNLLCIGDRSGQISPVIGEGIRYAFLSAELAARHCEAFLQGDKNALAKYFTAWKRTVGKRHGTAWLIQRGLTLMSKQRRERVVLRLASRTRTDPYFLLRILSTEYSTADLLRLAVMAW